MDSRSADKLSLPEDLLTEVLLRMPAAHAFAFRCLSKFYRRWICSSDFARKHYNQQIKSRQPSVGLCQVRYVGEGNTAREFVVNFDSTQSVPTVLPLINPDIDDEEREEVAEFVGCCRGILCYHIRNRNEKSKCLSFWNPTTGTCRRSFAKPLPGYWPTYFLGYDAVTDDIQVLQITDQFDLHVRVLGGFIYSWNSDSWRRTDIDVGVDVRVPYTSFYTAVFLEGTNSVNILCEDRGETRMVLAFDFAAEKSNLFSVPEPFRRILSLDDCLCVCTQSNGLNVWKMKEYGVDKSWTRVFYLKTYLRRLVPLTFINNGLQLLAASYIITHELDLYLCEARQGKKPKQILQFTVH